MTTVAEARSGTTTYAYDAQDRLVNAAMPSGTNITFAYDADGHRLSQTAGAQATKYLWDTLSPYGDVIRETDGTGTPLASYILGGMELLSQTRAGVTNFYLHDGQGSTRTLIGTSGTVTDSYAYDAFGNLQQRTDATNNVYQYTGQQFDAATGLYDLRARYYASQQGSFLSRDMWRTNSQNPAEINRYQYAANGPINGRDPSGFSAVFEFEGLGNFERIAGYYVEDGLKRDILEGALAGALGYIVGAAIITTITFAIHNGECSVNGASGYCQLSIANQFLSDVRANFNLGDLVFSAIAGGFLGPFYSASWFAYAYPSGFRAGVTLAKSAGTLLPVALLPSSLSFNYLLPYLKFAGTGLIYGIQASMSSFVQDIYNRRAWSTKYTANIALTAGANLANLIFTRIPSSGWEGWQRVLAYTAVNTVANSIISLALSSNS